MPKGSGKKKKKYGTGLIGQLKKSRDERKAAKSKSFQGKGPGKTVKKKRSLMEKVNPFDKESKARRKVSKNKRQADKINKPMKRAQAGKKAKGTGMMSTGKSRAKAIGAKAGTKVRRGAVKTKSTKGGDFVKYEKKSKAAGSFRSAFKSSCSGGAKSFTWDGRSYSCAKAGPKKAKKPIMKGGAKGSAEYGS